MKKKIDITALSNELQNTGFFRRSSPTSAPAADPSAPPLPANHTPAQAPTPDSTRTGHTPPTPVRPPKRSMIRHPFEVYHDQVEQLRDLALQERVSGGAGSMSRMVREAIDRLIEEKRREAER